MTTTTRPAGADVQAAKAVMLAADLLGPHAIRVAATLRLADHIDAGARSAVDLARRTGCETLRLTSLLRFLVAKELLSATEDGDGTTTYEVTGAGAPLRSGHPCSVATLLDNAGAFGRAERGFAGLEQTIRTGRPSYRPGDYWNDVNNDPASLASLSGVPGVPSQLPYDGDLVLHEYDWSSVRHVTDVGGGSGGLLAALLAHRPHLRGTVLDLPVSVTAATRRFREAGLADRADAVEGSFFDPLPGPSDVYLLSGILADWDDEQAVRILRRCRDAVRASGRVVLAEVHMDTPVVDVMTAFLDLYVSASVPVPVRTEEQRQALFAAGGLRVSWQGPGTDRRTLIELVPTDRP